MLRALLVLAALGTGVTASVAAVMVHPRWWGLLLAIAAVLAATRAWSPGWQRVAFAAGFVVVLGFAMTPKAEGDYLIASDAQGYALLALGLGVVAAAVATLPRPIRPRS
ncbi:hypothetical protein [Nocardioides sp.]|uniref:hypothetical protein n=1 Tax=Nocardioides sp. TaxID=35761 RepID=UPI0035634A61